MPPGIMLLNRYLAEMAVIGQYKPTWKMTRAGQSCHMHMLIRRAIVQRANQLAVICVSKIGYIDNKHKSVFADILREMAR